MAWLAECLRQKGYALRLSGLLPPAPLRRKLPPCEPPQTVLPHSSRVILSIPTAGADGLLRTPTVPEHYPLAECLELLPEGAAVLGGRLPPDCPEIVKRRHFTYTDLLALPELQELNAIATAEGAVALRQCPVPPAGGIGGGGNRCRPPPGTAGTHLCGWIHPLRDRAAFPCSGRLRSRF